MLLKYVNGCELVLVGDVKGNGTSVTNFVIGAKFVITGLLLAPNPTVNTAEMLDAL